MQTPLELYEAALREVSEGDICVDPWFTEQLGRARAGDDNARRAICGRCLGRVLDIVKKEWRPDCPLDMLEWVQENTVLWNFVKRFNGVGANEFLRQLPQHVRAWFALLRQHPEWARERRAQGNNGG
jgi:hypothetical protein